MSSLRGVPGEQRAGGPGCSPLQTASFLGPCAHTRVLMQYFSGGSGRRPRYLQVASQVEHFHVRDGIISGDGVSKLSLQLPFFPVIDFL